MEVKRRKIQHELNSEIRVTEANIDRCTISMKRLRMSNMGEDYVRKQIDKIKENKINKEKELDKLIEKLSKLELGELDDEINLTYQESKNIVDKKNGEKKRIRDEKKETANKGKEISKKYWGNIIQSSRSKRQKERDMQYGYRYFWKTIDSLPEYMQKKLNRMPNNKGYIWRDVQFFGKLPEEKNQPTFLFENKRGLYITHEYTKRYYRIYEKQGHNGRKKLVYEKKFRSEY